MFPGKTGDPFSDGFSERSVLGGLNVNSDGTAVRLPKEYRMRTVSFSIANYCVPCHSHCRYCLLSSCGQVSGVDYRRSEALAHRIMTELAEKRPDISGSFYIGYCMDTVNLWDYIRFSREHESPGASFLQMNGFGFREATELLSMMRKIREEGVRLIDLTFYGTEEYHDSFAGRKGDFRFVLQMVSAAIQVNLPVNISIPLLRSNLDQLEDLRSILSDYPVAGYSYFLPHSKGRGKTIQDQRITRQEFEKLPSGIRDAFWKILHQTEAEWMNAGKWEKPEKRNLTLVLTKENIQLFEGMKTEDMISYLETMDNRHLSQLPAIPELAERYGDPDNDQLFRYRDLLLKWQQQFIADTGKTIYDTHDETHHFSVHF